MFAQGLSPAAHKSGLPESSSSRLCTCERDLEDIVAKLKHGRYGEGWYKMRNPGYSQREGRRELFERKRTATA
jgi:hypothetical protein